MSDKPEPMPMEGRERITRHIQNAARGLMHKTNATGVICIVLTEVEGGYMHVIDGGTGQFPSGSFAEIYSMALRGHQRRDAGHEEGWTQ